MFYSDYVLGNKPFAYWPLNDDPPATSYTGNVYPLNVGEGHIPLQAYYNPSAPTLFHSQSLSALNDSIPLKGMTVSQRASSSLYPVYNSNSVSYQGSLQNSLGILSQSFEFILQGNAPQAGVSGGACVPLYYPVTKFGGLTLWLETEYAAINSVCTTIGSRFLLTWDVIYRDSVSASQYIAASVVHTFPFLGVGMIRQLYRVYCHVTLTSDTSLTLTVIVNTSDNPLSQTIPITFSWNGSYYPYNIRTSLYNIVPVLGNCTIGNFSCWYNRPIPPDDYFDDSWTALNTPPSSTTPEVWTTHLNNQSMTTQEANKMPNCITHQFDTVLCRGMSHRLFKDITSTDNGDGTSTVRLLLHTYSGYPNIVCHDFQIGDTVELGGANQSALNGHWIVSAIDFTSVSFIASGTFSSETSGLKVIKRPAIGFGSWRKEAAGNFSQYYVFGTNHAVRLDDTSSTATKLIMINRSTQQQSLHVWLRKNLKRDSFHWQPDREPSRIEFSVFGDGQRFIFVQGYKQTPKAHSHIVVFGTLQNWADEETKEMLLGFSTQDIGNVGENLLFMYPRVNALITGIHTAQADRRFVSGARMIGLDDTNTYKTLIGSADFGHHMYPINIPEIQGT